MICESLALEYMNRDKGDFDDKTIRKDTDNIDEIQYFRVVQALHVDIADESSITYNPS